MSSQKKFLVIGSNGQIGTVLTNRLGEKYGFENVVGSDLRPPENQTKFIFEECSVLDKDRLEKIIGTDDVELSIFNSAGIIKYSKGCVTWSGGYISEGEEPDYFVRY